MSSDSSVLTIQIDGTDVEVDKPKTVEVDGIPFTLVLRERLYGNYLAVQIKKDDLHRVERMPISYYNYDFVIEVVDDDGTVIIKSWYLESAIRQLEMWTQGQRRKATSLTVSEALAHIKKAREALREKGLPVRELDEAIRVAERAYASYNYQWGLKSFGDVQSAINRAQHEIERLEQSDPTELLVDELMTDSSLYPCCAHNRGVIAQLDALEIRNRSGGYIESITPEKLRRFYRSKLEGVTDVRHLHSDVLWLTLEDYAPGDMVAELELAPKTVELAGRKGSAVYPLSYAYEIIDGERVATASVSVPLSVYERNCAEHGRKSNFPEMPEGVRLMISVKGDGKLIARGEDGESLKKKLASYKKGKRHKGIVPDTDKLGLRRREAVQGSSVPPWFTGRPRW